MSINGGSTIVNLAFRVVYILIGCRHAFMSYWQPLGAKTTATRSLLHPENERQWSANSFRSCIFGNQGITWIFAHIAESWNALIGKNTLYQRKTWIPNQLISQTAKHAKT